jgi:hypothetical protein
MLDEVGTLTPYFEALILGAFGMALLLLQSQRPGAHPGFGRSIVTVGVVFAAIEVLPDYVHAPGLWSAAYSGWLFAILVALSGAWLAVRAWLPSRRVAQRGTGLLRAASIGDMWRNSDNGE